MVLYICEKFHKNILNGFQLRVDTSTWLNWLCSKGNNSKVGKPELRFMCSASRLIVLYICVKFGENNLKTVFAVSFQS